MLWDNLQAYSESAAQGRYGICRVVTSVLLDPWISFYTYSILQITPIMIVVHNPIKLEMFRKEMTSIMLVVPNPRKLKKNSKGDNSNSDSCTQSQKSWNVSNRHSSNFRLFIHTYIYILYLRIPWRYFYW